MNSSRNLTLKIFNLFPEENPIEVGYIGGAYGILGWVHILSFTSKSDNIFGYNYWFIYVKSCWNMFYVDQWKVNKKNFIAKIKGITNRESAKILTNCKIVISSKQLPILKKDEFYWKDLIGCAIYTLARFCLGYVAYIIDTPAHDVLVARSYSSINTSYKKKDILIPFIYKKVIKNVDLINQIITVEWEFNF